MKTRILTLGLALLLLASCTPKRSSSGGFPNSPQDNQELSSLVKTWFADDHGDIVQINSDGSLSAIGIRTQNDATSSPLMCSNYGKIKSLSPTPICASGCTSCGTGEISVSSDSSVRCLINGTFTCLYQVCTSTGQEVLTLDCGNGAQTFRTASANVPSVTIENLRISPNTVSVVAGGSTTFSASGGVPPYNFSVQNGVGSISTNSPSTAVYTAPASAATMAQVTVTDSAGNTASSSISISSNPSGTLGVGLTVSPLNGTVNPNGTLQFTASGGVPPYYYIVATPNGGSFSSTGLYSAPSSPQTVSLTFYDSSGATVQTTVVVEAAVGTAEVSGCSGTFHWQAGGYSGSLTIMQAPNGAIAGGMTWNGYQGTDYVQGTCSATSIAFTPAGNGQTWTGSIYPNGTNPTQVMWMGTISGANVGWSAIRQ